MYSEMSESSLHIFESLGGFDGNREAVREVIGQTCRFFYRTAAGGFVVSVGSIGNSAIIKFVHSQCFQPTEEQSQVPQAAPGEPDGGGDTDDERDDHRCPKSPVHPPTGRPWADEIPGGDDDECGQPERAPGEHDAALELVGAGGTVINAEDAAPGSVGEFYRRERIAGDRIDRITAAMQEHKPSR
jgi:hypothetical protein